MSQSSDAWAEIAIACEVARMEIALKTCEMLDVPVFSRQRIFDYEADAPEFKREHDEG